MLLTQPPVKRSKFNTRCFLGAGCGFRRNLFEVMPVLRLGTAAGGKDKCQGEPGHRKDHSLSVLHQSILRQLKESSFPEKPPPENESSFPLNPPKEDRGSSFPGKPVLVAMISRAAKQMIFMAGFSYISFSLFTSVLLCFIGRLRLCTPRQTFRSGTGRGTTQRSRSESRRPPRYCSS